MMHTITVPVTITIDVPDDTTVTATSAAPSAPAAAPVATVPVVATGTMPKTQHVLPVPIASETTWEQYAIDNYRAAGGISPPGFMIAGQFLASEAARIGCTEVELNTLATGGSFWPEMTDRFYNPAAYGITGGAPNAVGAPAAATLVDSYPNKAAFLAALIGYAYTVLLDNKSVHDGFGPADQFYTQPDGVTISRTQQVVAAPTPAAPASGSTPVPIG